MRTHRYHSAWRKGWKETEVTVVEKPDEAWFEHEVTTPEVDRRKFVRFALMEDGTIYFGDGFHVLHRDMMNIRDGKLGPLLIGVLVKEPEPEEYMGGRWKIVLVQPFMGLGDSPDKITVAQKLFSKHFDWIELIQELGYDPFDYRMRGMYDADEES